MTNRWFLRGRARRAFAAMPPTDAATLLHLLIEAERRPDPVILEEFALRAADGAEGIGKTILEKVAESYRVGRQIKFGTYAAEFRTVMVPSALEEEIESVFKEMKNDA